jgi:hypothetical protein
MLNIFNFINSSTRDRSSLGQSLFPPFCTKAFQQPGYTMRVVVMCQIFDGRDSDVQWEIVRGRPRSVEGYSIRSSQMKQRMVYEKLTFVTLVI